MQELEFTKLLKDSRPAIFSIITSMSISSDYYNDIYQEVSLRAWAAYSNFRNHSSFTTWICAIARYTTIDKMRKLKKAKIEMSQYLAYCLSGEWWVDEPYLDMSLPSIDTLTDSEKELLCMRMRGESFRLISHNTGEPEPRLRTRFYRIKQKLIKEINMN